jgi:hypothetical protein
MDEPKKWMIFCQTNLFHDAKCGIFRTSYVMIVIAKRSNWRGLITLSLGTLGAVVSILFNCNLCLFAHSGVQHILHLLFHLSSSSSVLCARCCLCRWIVYSWLSRCFSRTPLITVGWTQVIQMGSFNLCQKVITT